MNVGKHPGNAAIVIFNGWLVKFGLLACERVASA